MTPEGSGGLPDQPDFRAAFEALLPPPGVLLLVAVSAGADSMALWDLLVRDGRWPLIVWHLDHGLRPEAVADAALIRDQAARYAAAGLAPGEVLCESAEVAGLAGRWRLSLEAAGRRQRYARLALVARERGAAAVLTAHHRDDQSETVLANLLRGAGPVGIAGIAARRTLDGAIALLRPLLGFSRAEVRGHALAHGVRWLDDASNTDRRHRRNVLRHDVLPGLEAGVPGIAAELAALAGRSRVVADALDAEVGEVWQRSLGADGLALDGIRHLDARRRRHLWRRLAVHLGLPLERANLVRIDHLVAGAPGRRLHLGRWLLLRRQRALAWELAHPTRGGRHVTFAGPGDHHHGDETMSCRVLPRPETVVFAAGEAWLDAARCAWPLVWRAAGEEERFIPLGAPGRQTVVKFLAGRGVPSRLRQGAAVVADTHGVVWIPGFTIAERVKLTAATREVVHLHWTPACGTRGRPTVPLLQDDTDERS